MKFNCPQAEAENKANRIRMLLLDVDGVLTDGRLYFTDSGEEIKAFHTQDGHGIRMLQKAGIAIGIITGRNSPTVAKRASDLDIEIVYMGRQDKINVLNEIKSAHGFSDDEICYGGDDHPDLPVLESVGLSFSVPAAHADILSRVHCVTEKQGGFGAVREITDFLLTARGDYPQF